jgi:flagellar basal-body rod protein FlgB
MIQNSFTKTTDLIHRALDANTVRRTVLADNLANAETPNFKRTDVNFESQLKKALDSEKQRPALEMKLTHPKHISNWKEMDYREVEPRRVLDYVSASKNNGNNVDAEQEVMKLLQNQMTYMLLAQAETFEFSQVNLALR